MLKQDLLAANERVARLVERDEVRGRCGVWELHERLALERHEDALFHDCERTAEREELALEAVGRQPAHKHDLRGHGTTRTRQSLAAERVTTTRDCTRVCGCDERARLKFGSYEVASLSSWRFMLLLLAMAQGERR